MTAIAEVPRRPLPSDIAFTLRAIERALIVYRRSWRGTLFISFLAPMLYLAAIGVGLGGYVSSAASAALPGGSYLAFLAPALVAAQAMNVAAFECAYPVLGQIIWNGSFNAMLATPMRVRNILAAHLAWVSFRVILVSVAFLIVVALVGAAPSLPGAFGLLGVAVLTGFAFIGPVTAFSAIQRTDTAFAYMFRFVITPLYLFSGTFFPIDSLPEILRPVAYVTPLYHGVDLARQVTLGAGDLLGTVTHIAVLLVYGSIGMALAGRNLHRRLVK
jgi:lipooligosaccharide transport system permease protein